MTEQDGRIPFSVVIPIRNAIDHAPRQVAALGRQTRKPQAVIVIDSESSDGSPDIYGESGCVIVPIRKSDFDHGGTRNLGWRHCRTDIVIYLTQDAIPDAPDAFERICEPFRDEEVAIVVGRQRPRHEAGAIERHTRMFNYPDTSAMRVWPEARRLGIKAVFNSNSFAAYRRMALSQIGGFPESIIMGEDTVAAARALLSGWKVAYAADASVQHSHGYDFAEEFRRYFDVGVLLEIEQPLLRHFDQPTREGRRFVMSELSYLARVAPLRIPEALLRTSLKLLAYKLGRHQQYMPHGVKRRLAMHPGFFAAGTRNRAVP